VQFRVKATFGITITLRQSTTTKPTSGLQASTSSGEVRIGLKSYWIHWAPIQNTTFVSFYSATASLYIWHYLAIWMENDGTGRP
jgi:hypothetical protein